MAAPFRFTPRQQAVQWQAVRSVEVSRLQQERAVSLADQNELEDLIRDARRWRVEPDPNLPVSASLSDFVQLAKVRHCLRSSVHHTFFSSVPLRNGCANIA